MNEKKIKSAFEIAMEKMARIPTLTPEELARQRELEYAPRGEAIAEKYLRNALRGADLEIELRKYDNGERQIVREALLAALCRAIALEDADTSLRALEGIQRLAPTVALEDVKREVEAIFAEFKAESEKRSAAIESQERARLKDLGIAGSAIKPNPEAARDRYPEMSEIRTACEARLEGLKERLRHQSVDLG